MTPEKLTEILYLAENLKKNTRHSWLSNGRRESVAEHSWRLSLFAYFVKDEFPNVDMDKVIMMCIFHDLGEAFTGDIPSFYKTNNDEEIEKHKLCEWLNTLPQPYKDEFTSLYKEMDELKTEEAKLWKAMDKLEASIQHNEAEIRTWLPLEYELNPVYGEKECGFNEYMKSLQEYTKQLSLDKIAKESNCLLYTSPSPRDRG